MRIGLTGATGFLGGILHNKLIEDHDVYSIGRRNSFFIYDFMSIEENIPSTDLFIHCAGKAHVQFKKNQEFDFINVNVINTEFLLKSLQVSKAVPSFFVFISSVAVYGCDRGISINEDHSLDASDYYGLSKIQAEKLVLNWCKKNNVVCTILRLPLVVGVNPPGNLGAMINAIQKGYYFNIARGTARKSMVLAEDVAMAILKVAAIGGIYNLTDGCHPTFFEISNRIAEQLKKSKPFNLYFGIAKLAAHFGDFLGNKAPLNSIKFRKITSDLTFDDSKAREVFGWKPTPVLVGFRLVNSL